MRYQREKGQQACGVAGGSAAMLLGPSRRAPPMGERREGTRGQLGQCCRAEHRRGKRGERAHTSRSGREGEGRAASRRWRGRVWASSVEREELNDEKNELGFLTSHLNIL
jgi:hypothetical protein